MTRLGIITRFWNAITADKQATAKIIELSDKNYFMPWNGNLFENDVIRSMVRPKSNAISKLVAKHVRGKGELLKINPDAYFREILTYPNPYMSMQDVLAKLILHYELNNNAFAYVERDLLGYPSGIYPITCSSAEVVKEKNLPDMTFIKFYLLSGKNMIINYDDIIHLRKDFNSGEFFGDSGTKALSNVMQSLIHTDQSIVEAIKSSKIIKWILKFKSVLKPEDVRMQVDEFVKNYLSIESGTSNKTGAAASDPRYDLEQVKNENYVPNAAQMDRIIQRLYSYFGVNEKIVQNKFNEDDWNAFYEAELEPIIVKLVYTFTRVFFTPRERGFGNKITFDANNLSYASMSTKLGLVQFIDRAMMTPNEVRAIMNMEPIEGGDVPLRRLDTQPINTKEGANK